MFEPVPQHLNSKNLTDFSNLFAEIEHFIFFGTLLGIHREGDVLQKDDDIDFYIDITLRDKVINILEENNIYVDYDDWPNLSKNFLQIKKVHDGILTYIDIYFFENTNKDYIQEKWNFFGNLEDPSCNLHIPKHLIFPIEKHKYKDGYIYLPAKPENICKFLYGKNWRKPLSKKYAYKISLIFNKPLIFSGRLGAISFRMVAILKRVICKFFKILGLPYYI